MAAAFTMAAEAAGTAGAIVIPDGGHHGYGIALDGKIRCFQYSPVSQKEPAAMAATFLQHER